MFYPNEVIEDIRSGNDIVSVVSSYMALKPKGANHFGLCPFHQERTPSFSVNADKQMFYCFGCGSGGNVLTFVMQIENMGFIDALKLLADRIHYILPDYGNSEEMARQASLKEALYAIQKKAARFYYDCLQSPEGKAAAAYLDKRCINLNVRVKYGLGYAPGRRALADFLRKEGYSDDLLEQSGLFSPDKHGGRYKDRFTGRLMFPILDAAGRVVGFGGRLLGEGEPKYLNSPDTLVFDKSRNLYGIQIAKKSKSSELILVEGYLDVISLYQAGFNQAIASLGTAFNQNHARTVKKHRDNAMILFDSDDAGTKAALRAIPILTNAGLSVRVAQVKNAKDPDEYIKAFGAEPFAALLAQAKSHIYFQVDQLHKQYNLDVLNERVRFTAEASKLIAKSDNAIERDAHIKEIALMTGISADAISTEIDKARNRVAEAPLRVFEPRAGKMDKGAVEAKRGLLYYAAIDAGVCEVLSKALSPAELGEGVYATLLSHIYALREQSKECVPAALINEFDNIEDQKLISAVFIRAEEFPGKLSREKAINEMLKVLKKSYIDDKIRTADITQLNELVKMKRNVDKLYISI